MMRAYELYVSRCSFFAPVPSCQQFKRNSGGNDRERAHFQIPVGIAGTCRRLPTRRLTASARCDDKARRYGFRFGVLQTGCCACGVGYITRRYNARVIYAAWRSAALNGSSDVRHTVYTRPAVTYVEIRDL